MNIRTTKSFTRKRQRGLRHLHFILWAFLFFLSACGDSPDNSSQTSSDTGSIAFSLAWEDTTSERAVVPAAALSPSGDVCVDYAIDTISADVYNSSHTVIASASWPCSDHQGTISDVPTGSGMYLILEGTVSGNVHWLGQTPPFSMSAGQITDAGVITMNYIGDDTTSPNVVSTNPTDKTEGIPLDAVITATFNEDVVEASLTTSFTLETGGTPVPGSVTYNSSTQTATFTPDSNLSSFTDYTATITTDVEDLAGNQMADNYTWNFTTGAGDVSVSGTVIDATTADPISEATVSISGDAYSDNTTTANDGRYGFLDVPDGDYAISVSKTGYVSEERSIIVEGGYPVVEDFVLSPSLIEGEYRIVLTWDVDPSDLDSHLWTPNIEDSEYHIYFASEGSESSPPYAELNIDDTSSYGPETITIYRSFPGTYTYAVHHYGGEGSLTGTSQAKVKIYDSSGFIQEWNVPSEGSGEWWTVFELDGSSGGITTVNTISD